MGDAPQTLTLNRQSTENAVKAANALLDNARNVGMSDALDGEMSRYIDKAKKTLAAMNDRRKPVTQIMDAVKKEFTSSEADLKTKIVEVQTMRDGYATMKMEEQRKREREAQAKLARERESIGLRKTAETTLANNFTEHLREAKEMMLDKFNSITLSQFDTTIEELRNFSDQLTKNIYEGFRPALTAQYHSPDEIKEIASRTMNMHFGSDREKYHAEIVAYKQELLDKKQSKFEELEELEAADAAERERLDAERQARENADRERLNREANESRAKAAATAETTAAGEAAHAEIAAMAEVGIQEAQVRESYQITVNNVAANLLIAQMWFQYEGKKMPQDKIDRVTFERMRKFCEKHAMETGELLDSPFITYTEIFRAK